MISMINQWIVTTRDLKAFTWDALVNVPMPITLNGYLHRNTVKPNGILSFVVAFYSTKR